MERQHCGSGRTKRGLQVRGCVDPADPLVKRPGPNSEASSHQKHGSPISKSPLAPPTGPFGPQLTARIPAVRCRLGANERTTGFKERIWRLEGPLFWREPQFRDLTGKISVPKKLALDFRSGSIAAVNAIMENSWTSRKTKWRGSDRPVIKGNGLGGSGLAVMHCKPAVRISRITAIKCRFQASQFPQCAHHGVEKSALGLAAVRGLIGCDRDGVMRLPSDFDLHALEVFILTVELGGMTQCAQRLNITQSAVSQTIARLEAGIGAPLFDRALRPLGLTPAGRALAQRGENLLASAKSLYDEVRHGADKPLDAFTIGMSETLATQLTAPLIQQLGPKASSWKIRSSHSIKQHGDFLARHIDMLISGSNLLERIAGLEHRLVVEDPFLLIFPHDYDGPTDPAAVSEELPFIRYSLDCGMGQRVEQQLTRMKLRLPNLIEVDITHQQLTSVALGLGWSMASVLCLAVQPALVSKMRVLPLPRGQFSRRIDVISRAGELGELPEQVTQLARDVIWNTSFPLVMEMVPWLEDLIAKIGAGRPVTPS